MNSWNQSQAPAYNLKVHRAVDPKLQDTVLELMQGENFYDSINELIHLFGVLHDWQWQAGFNGRSGGYLVLYRGGQKPSGYKSYCQSCGQRNYQVVPDGQTGRCGRCGEQSRVNYQKEPLQVFSYPGEAIADDEVPSDVLRAFRRLAVDIVKETERMARECSLVDEPYVTSRKVVS